MRVHFNLHSHLSAFMLLGSARIIEAFTPEFPGRPAIFDGLCFLALLRLGFSYLAYLFSNLGRIERALSLWASDNKSRKFISIFREALSWVSMSFVLLWLSRWANGWSEGWFLAESKHYMNYLDAAALSSLLAWILSWPSVIRWAQRVDLSSARRVLITYMGVAILGAYLLILPFSVNNGKELKLIDSFFITVSALSVTGLSPVNIADTLTIPGQILVMFLIQIGGLGVVVLASGLALLTLRRLSLSSAMASKELYDIPEFGDMNSFLGKVVAFTLGAEIIGSILIYFSMSVDTQHRLFHAVFHSVSSFCNAGFSSFPLNLEASPLSLSGVVTVSVLVVLGGIGFPVLFEILSRGLVWKKGVRKLSAQSKMIVLITVFLLVSGAGSFFLLESVGAHQKMPVWTRLGQAVFYSVSSRTAGFNMIPLTEFQNSTVLIIMLLMVVGGGPLSTAGGVKVSTFGILFSTAWSVLRGLKWVEFLKREIPVGVVMKAVTVVMLYGFFCSLAFLLLIATEDIDSWKILFEVISAMSTVGLSLNATQDFSTFGKMVLILLMVAGRIGFVTVVYAGLGRREDRRFRYPEDRFYAG